MIQGMIDVRDAQKFCDVLSKRILDHMLRCELCRPKVRCMQYIVLAEARDILRDIEVTNAQKN